MMLLTILYLICILLMGIFTASQGILLALYLWHHRQTTTLPPVREADLPEVLIQLPLYNEKYVVGDLLCAVAALDYPRDRLVVQVLDDSDDNTVDQVARMIEKLRRGGLRISHIRRAQRSGYKAGALAYGLAQGGRDGGRAAEFVAIFDADFLPPRDFLRQTIPYLMQNPRLGLVQTRWGHRNRDANLLTRALALAIDLHFVVEQPARNRGGLLLTFNGTGGVWRRSCIEDAGGWAADTLTEDLDLSYRAQLKGWRYLYLPQIVVPGEIPPMLSAYKRQQARWAQGTNQCLLKLTPLVWRANIGLPRKLMAMQHLVQYLPHVLMLVVFLLTPILLLTDQLQGISLAWLGVVGMLPPAMFAISQVALGGNWLVRLAVFPVLTLVSTGMMPNNALAAYQAFRSWRTHQHPEFRRTPKFGTVTGTAAGIARDASTGDRRAYALHRDPLLLVECGFALYALFGCLLALAVQPAMLSYMSLYLASFTGVVAWQIMETWQLQRSAAASTVAAAGLDQLPEAFALEYDGPEPLPLAWHDESIPLSELEDTTEPVF